MVATPTKPPKMTDVSGRKAQGMGKGMKGGGKVKGGKC